jgi:hypothetical protein
MAKSEKKKEEKPKEWMKMEPAKRHRLLHVIDGELRGCHRKEPVSLFGRKYLLRTLDMDDNTWVDSQVAGENFYQTAKSLRAPTIAAALVGILEEDDDGKEHLVSVEELFELSDSTPDVERKLIESDPLFKQNWLRSQVLTWLTQPEKSQQRLVQLLYEHYLKLDMERNEAMAALDPLSMRTSEDGDSEATSSPERASSSPTPAFGE